MFRILVSIVLLGMLLASPFTAISGGRALNPTAAALGDDDYEARARMFSASSPLKGHADYRDRSRGSRGVEQRLSIEIQNGRPNTRYVVKFRGKTLGTITTNALGRGELNFRTARFIDGNNRNEWRPMPEPFPRVRAGEVISVGTASGRFAIKD